MTGLMKHFRFPEPPGISMKKQTYLL